MYRFTSFKEIYQAVDNGITVHWSNDGYIVSKDNKGRYLVQFTSSRNTVGLCEDSYKPSDFFKAAYSYKVTMYIDSGMINDEELLNEVLTSLIHTQPQLDVAEITVEKLDQIGK